MAISNSTDRFNGVVASLAIKVRCVVGVETDVVFTISGAPSGITNPYGGVFIADGDRVLLTAQINPIENGIWNASADGLWTRAADWDGNRDVQLGSTVWAGRSGIQSDILWQITNPAGVIQPGNTAVTVTRLLDPDSAGGISGTTIDSTVRFDGVEYVENLNLIVEADGRVTHPNAIPTRWLNVAATPVDLLDFLEVDTNPVGGASAVANFEGADGARTYTGDDGRVWTFAGSSAINDISNAQAKFGTTSYDFGGQGVQDDNIFTDITAEYDAGNFVMGVKDWFIKFWLWNDSSQVGGHDYGCIGGTVGSFRSFRWSNNNNVFSLAYDDDGGGSEDTFPTFGAAPTDGAWHEVIWERFGNGIYFYLDGVQQGATFDCTGDNIGGGLVAATKVLMIGSSIQNAVAGITPVPNSYIDAFEMVIGRSLYGGAAPGSPETTPPAPLDDVETMVVGDPASAVRIDANNLSINGAYDLPVADGSVGQVLITDGSGTVRFTTLATSTPIADGTVTNAMLRWSGAAWVQSSDLLLRSNGRLDLLGSGPIFRMTTSGAAVDEKTTDLRMDNFSGWRVQAVSDGGFNGPLLMSANRTGTAWQNLQIQASTEIFGSLYLDDAAGVQADIVTQGQLYVDSADDSLHYRTGAGVDTNLLAGGGGSGTIAADINTATPPTTEAVTANFIITDLAGDDNLLRMGFNASHDMNLKNLMEDGDIQIGTTITGGGNGSYIDIDADGGIEIRPQNTLTLFHSTNQNAIICTSIGELRLYDSNVLVANTATVAQGALQTRQTVTGNGATRRVLNTQDSDIGLGTTTIDEEFYEYEDSQVGTTPSNNAFRFNSVTLSAATIMYVDDQNESNRDIGDLTLGELVSGDRITVRDNVTPSRWVKYDITGAPTDLGGRWSIPVTYDLAGSGLIDNNRHQVRFLHNEFSGGVTTFAALTDTDVAGVADHDMLFFDTASGDWKDSGGLAQLDVDGATIGMIINSAASAKDGALLIQNGASALQSLSLSTNAASNYAIIQTPLLGNTELWLVAENGGAAIVMKASEVRIAGAIPGTDYVAFSDDDVDFNTVGNSKVDWNINGFTGAMNITGMDLDLNTGLLIEPVLADYSIQLDAQGLVADANVTLVYSAGPVHSIDLENWTANRTITLSAFPAGYGQQTVRVVQDGTVARTITWAGATFNWRDNVAHVQNATLNGISIYTFESYDGGTTVEAAGADYGP